MASQLEEFDFMMPWRDCLWVRTTISFVQPVKANTEMLYLRLSKKYLTFVLVITIAPCAMRHYITSAQNNNLCGKQIIDQPSLEFVKVLYEFRCFLVIVNNAKAGCCKPNQMFRSICNWHTSLQHLCTWVIYSQAFPLSPMLEQIMTSGSMWT